VGGVAFSSNLVLHSGVDDVSGHFVAAYGNETKGAMRSASLSRRLPEEDAGTRPRISSRVASPTFLASHTD